MSLTSTLRTLRRKLIPPGNRGSLETEYRQPNGGIRDTDLPTQGGVQKH